MATARVSESLWTCNKRWALETWIARSGHKCPPARARQPMSGAECVCRILAWMDQRCRPDGSLTDVDVDEIEFAAGWTGEPGVLCTGLTFTGWIDKTPEGMLWHDYGGFNGTTLRDRLKKRAGRPGTGRGHRSDLVGDNVGDKVRDEVGASGSGSGSGSGVRVPGGQDPDGPVGPRRGRNGETDHGARPPDSRGALQETLRRDALEADAAKAKADAWLTSHPGSALSDYRRASCGGSALPTADAR